VATKQFGFMGFGQIQSAKKLVKSALSMQAIEASEALW